MNFGNADEITHLGRSEAQPGKHTDSVFRFGEDGHVLVNGDVEVRNHLIEGSHEFCPVFFSRTRCGFVSEGAQLLIDRCFQEVLFYGGFILFLSPML